jgi:elongation factor Ts
MADIKASDVKKLREQTGVGMMDAKKALVENDGDMEASVDWLRKTGLAKASKKAGRTAAEGLVAIATDGLNGAVVEINSETDFVARNEQFQAFVQKVAQIALSAENTEDLAAKEYEGGKSVAETLTAMISTIGENMSLRRMQKLTVSQGAVAGYIHSALAPNLGKIGVLVALESSADAESLNGIGKQVAMHIAAARPEFLSPDSVDQAAADREKNVLSEQARASGKPEEIIEKMVIGRMRKYYEEVCLTEQIFVMDGETKISKVVEGLGEGSKLANFARFELGEGIEKEEEDFAAEVAAVANG